MNNNSRTGTLLFALAIAACLIFLILNVENTGSYQTEYWIVGLCMIVYLLLNFACHLRNPFYIFEPITLIFILYLFVFFVDPLLNIVQGTTAVMGFDVMGGCIDATLIFLVSYIAFVLGYYGILKKKTYKAITVENENINDDTDWKYTDIEKIAFILWIVSFCFGCIELIAKGVSPQYFLTLGLAGEIENLEADSAFGFLGNFRFSMITAWLYLFACRKKSGRTIICGILTLEYFVLRGFRHSLFVLILSPIIFLFVRKKSKPKNSQIFLLLIVIVLVMGIMQYVRGSLRSGTDVDWASFDSNIFVEAFTGNFDIYKTFYGMIKAVPSQLDYQFGNATILSVITMIIPRQLWPFKPVSPIITNLGLFCGQLAAKSGFAMPNIAEYYLDFGAIGCVVCLFLFGQVLQKLKNQYVYPKNSHRLILYSIMLPALMQVVLRGYSPSYIYLLLFYALPVIVIERSVRR